VNDHRGEERRHRDDVGGSPADSEDGRTVVELLAHADSIDPAAPSLHSRLAAVRGRADGRGVSATVDLHGKLVGLEFGREAMGLPPMTLAAVIQELAGRATAAALAEGVALLDGVGGPLIATALAARAEDGTEPPRPTRRPTRRAVADDEETYTPQTWAVPH